MSPRDVDSDRIWRCDCGGHHFLTVTAYGFDDPLEIFVSVLLYDHAGGLWDRFQTAWDILRHGKSCTGDVILDRKTAAEFTGEIGRIVQLASES